MAKQCEWRVIRGGDDHTEDVQECPACGGTYCAPCRDAALDKNRCPGCNAYVGVDTSCRLNGGCGR